MHLEQIAQAVIALFPVQTSESGLEATTHRVETSPVKGDPNSLDVVIVQQFPPPARRYELRIEKTSEGWLSHPVTGPDTYMAQTVAMRLQRKSLGDQGPPVKSLRNAEGLFACSFTTELPVEPAAADEPTLVPETKPEPRARRARELPPEAAE